MALTLMFTDSTQPNFKTSIILAVHQQLGNNIQPVDKLSCFVVVLSCFGLTNLLSLQRVKFETSVILVVYQQFFNGI